MECIQYKIDKFEGPLDLLLQLVAKNKLSIFDICIEELVDQYIKSIELITKNGLDISSEFLEMASRLVYIKAASLIPKNNEAEQLKEELKGQLIEYQRCKDVALLFKNLISFDIFCREKEIFNKENIPYEKKCSVLDLCEAYRDIILSNGEKIPNEDIEKPFNQIVKHKIVSVQSRIAFVLRSMWNDKIVEYDTLFSASSSRSELVATFLALLELIKENRIKIVYTEDNRINLRLVAGSEQNIGIEKNASFD